MSSSNQNRSKSTENNSSTPTGPTRTEFFRSNGPIHSQNQGPHAHGHDYGYQYNPSYMHGWNSHYANPPPHPGMFPPGHMPFMPPMNVMQQGQYSTGTSGTAPNSRNLDLLPLSNGSPSGRQTPNEDLDQNSSYGDQDSTMAQKGNSIDCSPSSSDRNNHPRGLLTDRSNIEVHDTRDQDSDNNMDSVSEDSSDEENGTPKWFKAASKDVWNNKTKKIETKEFHMVDCTEYIFDDIVLIGRDLWDYLHDKKIKPVDSNSWLTFQGKCTDLMKKYRKDLIGLLPQGLESGNRHSFAVSVVGKFPLLSKRYDVIKKAVKKKGATLKNVEKTTLKFASVEFLLNVILDRQFSNLRKGENRTVEQVKRRVMTKQAKQKLKERNQLRRKSVNVSNNNNNNDTD